MFTRLSWLDVLAVVLIFEFPFSKFSNHSQTCDTGLQISQASENFFLNSSDHTLSFHSEISFKEYVSQGISHPVCYGDLVYKLKRVRCEVNVVSSGSKIVKRLRRRTYDPVITKKTIGLVLGPSTSLYRSFLKHCTPTKNAVGSMWRDLSKPPQRRQGPDPSSLWLLVGTPSVLGPELASRWAEHILLLRMPLYILIFCFCRLACLCGNLYGLFELVGCWSSSLYKQNYLQVFKCVSFWLHSFYCK